MKVKTKRRICGWVSALSLFLSWGMAGGIETDSIPLGKGTFWMFVLLAIFALTAYKGGYMD